MNAQDTVGSSPGQQTVQGACVSETAVHNHGRRLDQREFRPMAEVPFRPVRQLSEYKGKGASANSSASNPVRRYTYPTSYPGSSLCLPRESTLVSAGHVAPKIWVLTRMCYRGGVAKCKIVTSVRMVFQEYLW